MRKKGLAGILSLLICIAIVGVGFASWVISGNDEETVTGNVEVDTITDNRVQIEIVSSETKLKFAGKSTTSETYPKAWLTTDITEDLVITINFKVSFKNTANDTAKNLINVSATCDTTNISSIITSNYVALKSTDVSTIAEDGTGTVTVTFKWGTAFNGKNPFDYYNSQEYSDALATAAYTALKALEEMGTKTITIKVTASYTSAA